MRMGDSWFRGMSMEKPRRTIQPLRGAVCGLNIDYGVKTWFDVWLIINVSTGQLIYVEGFPGCRYSPWAKSCNLQSLFEVAPQKRCTFIREAFKVLPQTPFFQV